MFVDGGIGGWCKMYKKKMCVGGCVIICSNIEEMNLQWVMIWRG